MLESSFYVALKLLFFRFTKHILGCFEKKHIIGLLMFCFIAILILADKVMQLEKNNKSSPEIHKNTQRLTQNRQRIQNIHTICNLDKIPSFHGHIKSYTDDINNYHIEYFNSTATNGMTKNEYITLQRGIFITHDNISCNRILQEIFDYNDKTNNFYKLDRNTLHNDCLPLYELFFDRYKNTKDAVIGQILTQKSTQYDDERLFYVYVNGKYIENMDCIKPSLNKVLLQNMIENDYTSFK